MLEITNRFFKKHPKLSYVSLAVFLVLVEVGFSYCSKKKCGGFVDANFDNWFPYKEGQTLYFLSNRNDRDTFSGLTIDKSAPYETGGGYSRGSCDMDVQIQNNQYVSPNRFNLEYHKFLEVTDVDYLILNFKDVQFYAMGINDSGLVAIKFSPSEKLKTTYYDTYNFNGTNYNKLQVVESDTATTKTNAVYKIWLAKNVGIVGYESYPSLERWAKQ